MTVNCQLSNSTKHNFCFGLIKCFFGGEVGFIMLLLFLNILQIVLNSFQPQP